MQTVEQTARRRKSNAEKFLVLMLGGGVILAALSFLFLRFGAESLSLSDILNAFFAFDEGEFKHVIARDIRLPRLLADIIVGVSLAVAGAVMQGNTKNPMADSGIMGISAGSVFAIVLMIGFASGCLPSGAHRLFLPGSAGGYIAHLWSGAARAHGPQRRPDGAFRHGDIHAVQLGFLGGDP